MRSIHSEWIVLNNFFGKDYISKMFNNFMSYKELRKKHTQSEIIESLNEINNLNK